MTEFKPMLAAKCSDASRIKYPVLVSPKIDGMRCLIHNGQAVSRRLEPIPNQYVQSALQGLPDGLDGELVVGAPNAPDTLARTYSGVMAKKGIPNFTYIIFDDASSPNLPHEKRMDTPHRLYLRKHVIILRHVVVEDASSLEIEEQAFIDAGYEGLMLRDIDGPYKFGRSTEKEGYLLKLKRWRDAEAQIIGFTEEMRNNNPKVRDATNKSRRSSHKHNKTGKNTLGALICKTPTGETFELGSGFSSETRKRIWENQTDYIDRLVKYKYFEMTKNNVPRFPSYLQIRELTDT